MVDAVADDDGARGADRHSRLVGLELGELILDGGQPVDHREHDLLASLAVETAPLARVERLPCRCDRAVRVFPIAVRYGRDHFLGRGVDHLEGLARRGVDPLPADVVLVMLDLDARSGVDCHRF